MKAANIQRYSIVKHEGKEYVLENQPRKPLLITEENGQRTAKEIKYDTELEVVLYPAQLAFNYIGSKK